MGLYDAHVHLDFMTNAREVAEQAAERSLRLFANTVTPDGYVRAAELLGSYENVQVGLGLHPWWIADGRCGTTDVERFLELLPCCRWVGEVGLDFSAARARHEEQDAAFIRIAEACAVQGNKTVSIHSVRSVSRVLDILAHTGCADTCTCVLHWFSGSTEDLWRAIRLGCSFSVNACQARTRRAKEQLKLIPDAQLLFETDLPPEQDVPFSAQRIEDSLLEARRLTYGIRGGAAA